MKFSIVALLSIATLTAGQGAAPWSGGSIHVAPPPDTGYEACDPLEDLRDDCGEEGQPDCCYSKYQQVSCFEGGLAVKGFTKDGLCDHLRELQEEDGCHCPEDCTTGDYDGKGKCV